MTDTAHLLASAVSQLVAESRLSKSQFAHRAEISEKQLKRLMDGEIANPHDHTLRKIAEAAGRDSEELIAVRDRGEPLGGVSGEQSNGLSQRVESLERQVADMAVVLREVREVMLPAADEPDPEAR